jgi:hypothetical protein
MAGPGSYERTTSPSSNSLTSKADGGTSDAALSSGPPKDQDALSLSHSKPYLVMDNHPEVNMLMEIDTPSPSSTQRSRRSSGTFSYKQKLADTDTEVENESTESEQDGTDFDTETEETDYSMALLESHLLSVLGCDWDLAARLIPKVHSLVQLELAQDLAPTPNGSVNAPIADSESQNGSEAQDADGYQGRSSPSSSASTNRNAASSQSHGYQSGGSNNLPGSGDHGDEESPTPDPWRPNTGGNTPSSGNNPCRRPRFACHFHKKDPHKYSPENGRKYRVCTSLNLTELRRIKYVSQIRCLQILLMSLKRPLQSSPQSLPMYQMLQDFW